jgi:dihydrofolate reductase
LASGTVAEEIERLRAEPGEGEIAIGGATLAAEAAALDLIDEYRIMVYPVLVGGGLPFFPQAERRVDLELVETRTFNAKSSTTATACSTSPIPVHRRRSRSHARGPCQNRLAWNRNPTSRRSAT